MQFVREYLTATLCICDILCDTSYCGKQSAILLKVTMLEVMNLKGALALYAQDSKSFKGRAETLVKSYNTQNHHVTNSVLKILSSSGSDVVFVCGLRVSHHTVLGSLAKYCIVKFNCKYCCSIVFVFHRIEEVIKIQLRALYSSWYYHHFLLRHFDCLWEQWFSSISPY
jgi:hypothetical protein